MDKLRQLSSYAETYMREATQLATYRYAREWMEADVPAGQAAKWASLGYQPSEAAPLIADGVTPEMADETDELGDSVAGGPEQRATQMVDDLVARGVLADPSRVHVRQDPDDPNRTIVDIEGDVD